MPKKYKLAFIKGYLDADGCVGKNGRTIFECGSENLIIKLKALLDGLGFVTGNIGQREIDNSHFKKYIKKKFTTLFSVQLYSPAKVAKEIGSEIEIYSSRLSITKQRMVQMRQIELIPSMPEGFSEEKFGFSKVKSIKNMGMQNTYDIQVEGTHNYISNGIVTHNTIMADDIEDNSKERRGKPCAHYIFGIDIALNASNIMYFLPLIALYRNTQKIDEKTKNRVYDLYAEEMIRVSAGQALDIQWHKEVKFDVTEQQYMQMVVSKTGVLARMAAMLGAILGKGNEKQVQAFGKFGMGLGVGFQIQDDILNLVPASQEWGKEIGDDISEGKITLLVIKTLEKATAADKKKLIEILRKHTRGKEEISEAIAIIKKYGAIDYANKKAIEVVEKAWKKLEKELPESRAKKLLGEMAEFAVKRKI